jgi:NADPH-dependent 2,4-dienoyl-CoA reductase/sulfur reductase-like enzyme
LHIVVLGGGPTGLLAASEASDNGARVTLLEGPRSLSGTEETWLGLVGGPPEAYRRLADLPGLSGVEVIHPMSASKLLPNVVVFKSGERLNFDAVVVATGSRPLPQAFPGSSKEGVYILDSPSRFVELGRSKETIQNAVVSGGGASSLRLAEALRGSGRVVTVLTRAGEDLAGLSGAVWQIMEDASMKCGVSFLRAPLERAVGLGSVESVVVGGQVVPCQALALLPRSAPNLPPLGAELGPHGGVLVDGTLRSSVPNCYAAGECAEFAPAGRPPLVMAGPYAKASGRVAGANASGLRLECRPLRCEVLEVFGLHAVAAGLWLEEARIAGFDAVEVTRTRQPDSACTIVYDRPSKRILGIQVVRTGPAGACGGVPLAVSQSLSLATMGYQDGDDSTDISLVAETAREGVRLEAQVFGQGSRMRSG